MIDYLYEREKKERYDDARTEWIMQEFDEWCGDICRKINDDFYNYTYVGPKDIRRVVKDALKQERNQ